MQYIQPKFTGNFDLKLNGSVWSNPKSFEKISPPFQVDLFSQLDQSNRNGQFHLTFLNTLSIPVPHSSVFAMYNNEGTHLSLQLLWIVNSGAISVTHTSMCSYNRSEAASQVKCMFWLLTALKDNLFPQRICNVLFIICLLKITRHTG